MLSDVKAVSVISFFYEDIISKHGCSKGLLTDQGTHFVNKLLDFLCNQVDVKHQLFTVYHLQTNGLAERFIQTLCKLLAKYSDKYWQDWDVFLPSSLFAYQTMRQNTTP
jgi:transposase InsO family protein